LSKHFCKVCRSFQMGEWVHIPVIGKIGFLRNFLLYTAKIMFFDYTVLHEPRQPFKKYLSYVFFNRG
jgi:hypothetical protein